MRSHLYLRTALGVAMLAALLVLALPGHATAASWYRHHHGPVHNRGLTIAATPDPVTAGQSLLIYGQLKGPNNANRAIVLYHRINPAPHFSPVLVTHTNAQGFYEIVRADGVVTSNRNWYVVGPYGTHSRTVHELASAVVTMSTASATATTADHVAFTGTVYPNHAHQRVLLQQQNSTSGSGWSTIASGYTNGSSAFSITNRFRTPGNYTLRAYFPGDPRNTPGESADVTLTVQQQQNPSFTINGSAPVITDGQPVTISGTLFAAGSTTAPRADTPVTLYGKQLNGKLKAIASATTDASGNYTFTQVPLRNTVYRVRTAAGQSEESAALYVGVQDVVTATVNTATVALGDSATISGTVTPAHSGHVITLQEQNAAGAWVNVEAGFVSPSSTYSFLFVPGQTGTLQLRVQITGGPVNVGGVSAPVTLTVNGLAAVSTLPPAT